MTLTNEIKLLRLKVKTRIWLRHHFTLLLIILVIGIVSVPTARGAEIAHNGTAKVEVGSEVQTSAYTVPVLCTLTDVHCEEETVEGRIRIAARVAGVNENTAVRIAICESSLNPKAKHSISTAKGLFMFTDPTWKFIGAKGSQFDEAENIKQFMINYKKYPQWWVCK